MTATATAPAKADPLVDVFAVVAPECPQFCVQVLGIMFTKYRMNNALKDHRGKPLPSARERERLKATSAEIAAVRERMSEPFALSPRGEVVSGIGCFDPKQNKLVDAVPFLKLELASDAPTASGMSDDLLVYYRERDEIGERMVRLSDRLGSDGVKPDEAKRIRDELDELKRKRDALRMPGQAPAQTQASNVQPNNDHDGKRNGGGRRG